MTGELKVPDDYDVGAWLRGEGDDADIAICTRVRLARNVRGFRFSTNMTAEEARELLAYVSQQIDRLELRQPLRTLDLADVDDLARQLLLERHLVSRELVGSERSRGVAVDDAESVSVMINEEDHVRAQVFRSGHSVDQAYQEAEAIDEALTARLPIAFSEEFGFLTACPTNTGTGLRVSVMLHLPGLVWSGDIGKATTAAQKTNMAVRGLYGEGSQATGDFYQVSNQITLGRSERQITSDVTAAVRSLVNFERRVRTALLRGEPRDRTLDRVFRALGTLERAHILTTDEALTCLSAVRFGMQQRVIDHIPLRRLNTALLVSQPGHLQRLAKRTMTAAERDQQRASLMRGLLQAS